MDYTKHFATRLRRLVTHQSDPIPGTDQVALLKLEALEKLTHEDLRGNRMFLIFLTQCANLISKIQAKLNQLAYQDQVSSEEERG